MVILKEGKTASLREAESELSEYVCGRRIDHATIHYWEKNIDPKLLEKHIGLIGSKLEQLIDYEFSVIDATSFSSWHMDTTGFHLVNRIGNGTVYPVSVCPDTFNPVPNTRDSIISGEGLFMGDKWYDVNGVFRIVYKNGYTPLISPQRTRCSGSWRRKARKVYAKQWMKYRQRGRGESVFGSLTNAYGDRLHTRRKKTTYVRYLARIISYQIRILIRVGKDFSVAMILVRHAPERGKGVEFNGAQTKTTGKENLDKKTFVCVDNNFHSPSKFRKLYEKSWVRDYGTAGLHFAGLVGGGPKNDGF